jgi:hypothetical protein
MEYGYGVRCFGNIREGSKIQCPTGSSSPYESNINIVKRCKFPQDIRPSTIVLSLVHICGATRPQYPRGIPPCSTPASNVNLMLQLFLNFNTSLQSPLPLPQTDCHYGSSIFFSRKLLYPSHPASSADHQPRTSSRCSLSSPYPACAWYNRRTPRRRNNSDGKWHNCSRYVSALP